MRDGMKEEKQQGKLMRRGEEGREMRGGVRGK